jgi:hypothetical protein
MPAAATSHSPAANTCPEVIAVDQVYVEADHGATPLELERGVRQVGAGGQQVLGDQAYALDGRAAGDRAAGGQE